MNNIQASYGLMQMKIDEIWKKEELLLIDIKMN